jgi:hypothetical protein
MASQVSESDSEGIKSQDGAEHVQPLEVLLRDFEGISSGDEGFLELLDPDVVSLDPKQKPSKKCSGEHAPKDQAVLIWSVMMKDMVSQAKAVNGEYRPLRTFSTCTGMWTEGKSFQVQLSNSTCIV